MYKEDKKYVECIAEAILKNENRIANLKEVRNYYDKRNLRV